MKSNAYEEVINPSTNPSTIVNVKTLHADKISKIGVPNWSLTNCPYCKEVLPITAIRSISLKLNPRNIGDVCVEFLCPKCEMGNQLYFPRVANTIQDFIELLNNSKQPSVEPITEEEMYKQKYHNLLDTDNKGNITWLCSKAE